MGNVPGRFGINGEGKELDRRGRSVSGGSLGFCQQKKLATDLGRSINSINVRAQRNGLGAFLDNGEYVSYSQFLQALFGLCNAGSAYRVNKRWEEFPVKKKRVGRCTFRVVYLDEFWKWAEQNRRLIDFSKMEENILGAEPDWVKQKRKIDHQCRVRINPWTNDEDRKLDTMVREHKMTITQIAAVLGRSEGAVKRRIYDICIEGHPVKNKNIPWGEDETQTLLFMYEEGWSFEKIGAELGRSASSCRGKVERLANPEYFYRENRRRRNEQNRRDNG